MGKRDSLYQLDQIIELDEEFFRATADEKQTDESTKRGRESQTQLNWMKNFFVLQLDEKQTDESKKRGRESQTQAKVLVMISSRISMNKDKDLTKYAKPTQLKYIEMHVIDNLKDETMTDKIKQETKPDSVVKTDDFRSYSKLSEDVCSHFPMEVTKEELNAAFHWVHKKISNAKRNFNGIYNITSKTYFRLF